MALCKHTLLLSFLILYTPEDSTVSLPRSQDLPTHRFVTILLYYNTLLTNAFFIANDRFGVFNNSNPP